MIGVIRILKKYYAALTSNAAATYTANDLNQYASTTYPTEAFAYDDDGNLTQDGTFDCTWDAGTLDATANAKRWSLWIAAPPPVVSRENRLIEVQTRIDWGQYSDAYETGDKHVYFTYDYMGP